MKHSSGVFCLHNFPFVGPFVQGRPEKTEPVVVRHSPDPALAASGSAFQAKLELLDVGLDVCLVAFNFGSSSLHSRPISRSRGSSSSFESATAPPERRLPLALSAMAFKNYLCASPRSRRTSASCATASLLSGTLSGELGGS